MCDILKVPSPQADIIIVLLKQEDLLPYQKKN